MADVKIKHKRFIYKNSIKWHSEKKGLLSSPGKPNIEIATPAEFRGHPGIWSPEDLFVASVNSCIMTTFLYYAEKEDIEFSGYESRVEGILERRGDQFMFSEIKVMPKIYLKSYSKTEKVKKLMALSEKNCLISHSIKSKVIVIPEINIEV